MARANWNWADMNLELCLSWVLSLPFPPPSEAFVYTRHEQVAYSLNVLNPNRNFLVNTHEPFDPNCPDFVADREVWWAVTRWVRSAAALPLFSTGFKHHCGLGVRTLLWD